MKCPNCNQEVSPEWKTCPYCEYKPKLCSKDGCTSGWLSMDAHFCPSCGSPIKGEENLMLREYIEELIRKKISTNSQTSPVQKERNVSVGDILCTDGTTMPVSEWPAVGKNAMGVVFYVDDTGKHGWAVHLQDQGKCRWTACSKDSLVYGVHTCGTEKEALADEDGCANTKALRAAGNASVYPAAYAVDFGLGWYLPALGQLKKLYNLRERLNTSLLKVKGEEIEEDWYWSSTQYGDYFAWFVTYHGGVHYLRKHYNLRVRSVRAF